TMIPTPFRRWRTSKSPIASVGWRARMSCLSSTATHRANSGLRSWPARVSQGRDEGRVGVYPPRRSRRRGCSRRKAAARGLSEQATPAPAHIFAAQAIIAAQGIEDRLAQFGRKTPPLVGAIFIAAKVCGLVRGLMRLPGEGHAVTFAKACWVWRTTWEPLRPQVHRGESRFTELSQKAVRSSAARVKPARVVVGLSAIVRSCGG